MHDLEVLDGGLGDSAVEVENMRLSFVVPHWRLVVKLDQIFHPPILVSYQQAITFLRAIGTTRVRSKRPVCAELDAIFYAP